MHIKDISYLGDTYSRFRVHSSTTMTAILDQCTVVICDILPNISDNRFLAQNMKDISFIMKTLNKLRINDHSVQLRFAEILNRVLTDSTIVKEWSFKDLNSLIA